MKRGWWELKVTEVDDGFEANEIDLEHIAELVKQGYTSGQLINEDDEHDWEVSE